MGHLRVVSLNGLRRRLRDALGDGSPLFTQFDEALGQQDEHLINVAMDALQKCPPDTRQHVQDAIVDWLFDGTGTDLADLPAAATRH